MRIKRSAGNTSHASDCAVISNGSDDHSALIERQNDFTSEGDALHGGVRVVMESANMLANHSARPNQAAEQF
jgi:hypothetical protein